MILVSLLEKIHLDFSCRRMAGQTPLPGMNFDRRFRYLLIRDLLMLHRMIQHSRDLLGKSLTLLLESMSHFRSLQRIFLRSLILLINYHRMTGYLPTLRSIPLVLGRGLEGNPLLMQTVS